MQSCVTRQNGKRRWASTLGARQPPGSARLSKWRAQRQPCKGLSIKAAITFMVDKSILQSFPARNLPKSKQDNVLQADQLAECGNKCLLGRHLLKSKQGKELQGDKLNLARSAIFAYLAPVASINANCLRVAPPRLAHVITILEEGIHFVHTASNFVCNWMCVIIGVLVQLSLAAKMKSRLHDSRLRVPSF